jgi:uncharacterized protein
MLRRKFYDILVNWKQTKKNECLLVNGARQVGKTFIIEQFGNLNYKKYIYLNLLKNPEQRDIFEGSLEPDEIYKRLSLYVSNVELIVNDTLIFIDEIQVCPKARTALKFLAMDSKYDVVASGSLLGIHYNKTKDIGLNSQISIPVGYERELTMYSLDFEEFLWANGISGQAMEKLKEYYVKKEVIPSGINDKYLKLLREYLVVGGMPEVVNTYLATSNFQEVYKAQQKIFKSYEDDIEQYATNLAWLEDAGLVHFVKNVSLPVMPLKAYEQPENFKLYTTDIGLTTSMYGFETQKALLTKTLIGPAKGGIYENLIFDILHKRGFELYYFKRKDNSKEIEFIYEKDGAVIPIEVKSKRGETESLNEFISYYKPPYALKLIDGNLGVDVDKVKVTLPQYMAMFIS